MRNQTPSTSHNSGHRHIMVIVIMRYFSKKCLIILKNVIFEVSHFLGESGIRTYYPKNPN